MDGWRYEDIVEAWNNGGMEEWKAGCILKDGVSR
jgi:hypothetical protein